MNYTGELKSISFTNAYTFFTICVKFFLALVSNISTCSYLAVSSLSYVYSFLFTHSLVSVSLT